MNEEVTGQRRREPDLRLARLTVEHAPEAIWWTRPDGRLTGANESATRLLGYSRRELLAMSISDVDENVPAEKWPKLWETLGERRFLTLESSLRRKDGGSVPVELTVNRLKLNDEEYCCTFARDITDRRRAERALQASEERYRDLFESAAAMVWTIDLDGHITSVNRTAEAFCGFGRDELVGKNIAELLPADQLEVARRMSDRKLHEDVTTTYDLEIRTKDGRRRPMRITSRLIHEGGVTVGAQGIGIDISEQRRAEEALRRSQDELRGLAARLLTAEEAEHRWLAGELHDDFNQRLALVSFELAKLEESLPRGAPASFKKRLHTTRDRILSLSDDLRRLSHQLHPAVIELLGLPAALRGLCREGSKAGTLQMQFRGVRLPESIPEKLALCLYRVTQEGLRNVVKQAQASKVSITLSRTAQGLRLSIRDNGVGFDPGLAAKHGLGLVSVRERVRLVGGTLSIKSKLGKGTHMVVETPL